MEPNGSLPANQTEEAQLSLDPVYAALEGVVAVSAVLGNGVVLVAFARERRLRRRTNYYIASLAVADLLVGLLGVPCALLAAVGLPRNLPACLGTLSVLLALCTSSILSLVAVSLDRYWAILHPLVYSRHMRTRTSFSIICACWAVGLLVGLLPVMGWYHLDDANDVRCVFDQVMDHRYLVFVYFATIVAPVLLLAFFYAHIYQVVRKQQVRQAALSAAQQQQRRQQQRDVRTAQQLAVIVAFFALCWLPLYTLNCVQAFRSWRPPPAVLNACIVLSHLNSAGNPLLYAYHLRDFRAAFRSLLLPAGACQQAVPRLSPLGAACRRARTLASVAAAAPHAATAAAAASAAFTACAAPGPGAAAHVLLRHLRCSPQKLQPTRRPTEIVTIALAAPNGRSSQQCGDTQQEVCRIGRQAC